MFAAERPTLFALNRQKVMLLPLMCAPHWWKFTEVTFLTFLTTQQGALERIKNLHLVFDTVLYSLFHSENVENAASVDGMPISDAQQPVIDWDISIEPTEVINFSNLTY